MDYIEYVNQRVKDIPTRERILKSMGTLENYGGNRNEQISSFINNFTWRLPGLRASVEERIQIGEVDPTKILGEYDCYRNTSDRFKSHSLSSFFREIDETVIRLGISQERLAEEVKRDMQEGSRNSIDNVFRVLVELMSMGYFRHELSR